VPSSALRPFRRTPGNSGRADPRWSHRAAGPSATYAGVACRSASTLCICTHNCARVPTARRGRPLMRSNLPTRQPYCVPDRTPHTRQPWNRLEISRNSRWINDRIQTWDEPGQAQIAPGGSGAVRNRRYASTGQLSPSGHAATAAGHKACIAGADGDPLATSGGGGTHPGPNSITPRRRPWRVGEPCRDARDFSGNKY
jgi:hypothetical protein